MAATTLDPSFNLQINGQESPHRGVVVAEIDGLIRVYKDGHVERPQIVPSVACSLAPELGVTCRDMIIDKCTNVWARFIFLAGDSAGANIAYNVALRVSRTLETKGLILIQPFFGGERRTHSENYTVQPPRSALTLAASDTYWRLSLPSGANRDHPWCNPAGKGAEELRNLRVMVCISEMDILKDRNLELCSNLRSKGVKVEQLVCKGVGHAFQILKNSALSQSRVLELIRHISNFMGRCVFLPCN
ncbi:UNVERIFIED_CONTAM: putative carboxylesterase 6 [Sesamum angustifolium]|uniref:Carboxylesterase 6 n=1 Tax=Sesamum angustifolium TaxID=2727405 RepID=A0AAW2M692_9LAMI